MENQVRENTASIAELKIMCKMTLDKLDGTNQKIHDSIKATNTFIDKFYEIDKPIIEESKRFIKMFWRVFWLIASPIIAGVGLGVIIAGTHFMKGLPK